MEIAINFKTAKKYQTRKTLETALQKNNIPEHWRYLVVQEPNSNMVTPVFIVQDNQMPGMLSVVRMGYTLVGG